MSNRELNIGLYNNELLDYFFYSEVRDHLLMYFIFKIRAKYRKGHIEDAREMEVSWEYNH